MMEDYMRAHPYAHIPHLHVSASSNIKGASGCTPKQKNIWGSIFLSSFLTQVMIFTPFSFVISPYIKMNLLIALLRQNDDLA